MSAGEFFDLVRPALLFLSAVLSTWVLVNAHRSGIRIFGSLLWAIATLILPFVTVPLYLTYKIFRRRSGSASRGNPLLLAIVSILYLSTMVGLIFAFEHRESNSVDRHLAKATEAKLAGDRRRAINEYKAALQIENDPHTRKLLGLELSDEGEWQAALSELQSAERGGEPDPSLPFRIARLLDALNQTAQATMEYKRFLYSEACTKLQPDSPCEIARQRVEQPKAP